MVIRARNVGMVEHSVKPTRDGKRCCRLFRPAAISGFAVIMLEMKHGIPNRNEGQQKPGLSRSLVDNLALIADFFEANRYLPRDTALLHGDAVYHVGGCHRLLAMRHHDELGGV